MGADGRVGLSLCFGWIWRWFGVSGVCWAPVFKSLTLFCPVVVVLSWGFGPERDGWPDQASQEHLVDALAPRGDEGRGTLR